MTTPTEEWTSNYRAPWKCVGGPFRGHERLCGTWAVDFLVKRRDRKIVVARYVRAVRVNKRARKATYFLRYFGTRSEWSPRFDAASRKAAV